MSKKKTGYNGSLDKRIIEKQLSKGTISEENLKKYLAQLPDVSDNVKEVVINSEET
ncbi:MAG: hypothetical protein Q7J27_09110 [Syntrophales bacterium]|nr:hypothetical protein [Syntrophales bacterium]